MGELTREIGEYAYDSVKVAQICDEVLDLEEPRLGDLGHELEYPRGYTGYPDLEYHPRVPG